MEIDSGDRMARAMALKATEEHSASCNGIPMKTSPVGYEGVRPINAPLNAGAVASNDGAPDRSPNTNNAERNTDMDRNIDAVDEGQFDDIANKDVEPRIVIGSSRGPVLSIEFEGNVAALKARLISQGANKEVVELCDSIFEDGVTIEALEKRMTREQCEGLGVRDGKQFRLFLELVVGGNGHMTGRHRCCLCSPGKEYKTHRDALRHLLKDHFGLSFGCKWW